MKIKLLIGILISLIFLVWAFRDVDIAQSWNTLKTVKFHYVLLSVILSIVVFIIRSYRWKFLLILQKDIPFMSVFSANNIGFFANNVLPFRAGELVRAYVIGRNENIPKSTVLATILVERVLDVLSLLFIAVAAILFLPIPQNDEFELIKTSCLILFAIELLVILICYLLLTKREATLNIFNRLLKIFPEKIRNSAHGIIDSFITGLEIFRAAKHFSLLIFTSFLIWLVVLIQIAVMITAFNINFDLFTLFIASVIVMVFISLILTLPSAPGFVGTYHAAAKTGITMFSVNPDIAISLATILHLSAYIPVTIMGFYYLLKENIKISDAKKDF
ncbi:lysylphosphatidylglycerol synthase transmembrane domain-containing protein [candidate division KSB1 bacterium]